MINLHFVLKTSRQALACQLLVKDGNCDQAAEHDCHAVRNRVTTIRRHGESGHFPTWHNAHENS
jgi:hypothetical protein